MNEEYAKEITSAASGLLVKGAMESLKDGKEPAEKAEKAVEDTATKGIAGQNGLSGMLKGAREKTAEAVSDIEKKLSGPGTVNFVKMGTLEEQSKNHLMMPDINKVGLIPGREQYPGQGQQPEVNIKLDPKTKEVNITISPAEKEMQAPGKGNMPGISGGLAGPGKFDKLQKGLEESRSPLEKVLTGAMDKFDDAKLDAGTKIMDLADRAKAGIAKAGIKGAEVAANVVTVGTASSFTKDASKTAMDRIDSRVAERSKDRHDLAEFQKKVNTPEGALDFARSGGHVSPAVLRQFGAQQHTARSGKDKLNDAKVDAGIDARAKVMDLADRAKAGIAKAGIKGAEVAANVVTVGAASSFTKDASKTAMDRIDSRVAERSKDRHDLAEFQKKVNTPEGALDFARSGGQTKAADIRALGAQNLDKLTKGAGGPAVAAIATSRDVGKNLAIGFSGR